MRLNLPENLSLPAGRFECRYAPREGLIASAGPRAAAFYERRRSDTKASI
jgi:hypothetical protein